MALYKEISTAISSEELTKEIYRFQGAKTLSRLDLSNPSSKGYIYYSNSIDHHMYFTVKRLKQMVNEASQKELGIVLNSHNLRGEDTYQRIKKLVINSPCFNNIHSYRIRCSRGLDDLVRQNCVYNENKRSDKHYVERVDRRVYGGGYGLADEWKELLVYLTFFTAYRRITREDILNLMTNMKTTGRMNRKDNISFLLKTDEMYTYEINPHILGDFNKYNIMNALEEIIERGLVNPHSELCEQPHETMKTVIENYERGREKTLKLLEKKDISFV